MTISSLTESMVEGLPRETPNDGSFSNPVLLNQLLDDR